MKYSKALLLLAAGWLVAASLRGVETTFWQVGTFEEFLQGTLRDVSLSKEGELTLAPESRSVFNPEEALALSLASDKGGNLYLGTGHQGKVFRVDAKLQGSLFFTAEESDVFALAAGPDGALYVGTSPEGKIYRVTSDAQSSVFYDPKAKYIWALAFDSKGNLFAATGDQGKILKIDSAGKGDVFFDTKQTHIMCLTFDAKGNLLAGSVPNGLVYRITPEGKAFVLYQDSLPEIHELALDAAGRIYAAALGGAAGKVTPQIFAPAATPTQAPTTVTTVTVTAGTEDASESSEPAQTPTVTRPGTPSLARPAPVATAFPTRPLPKGKGSLIQIRPDYTAETLWSSDSESIFGLAVRENQVLFSTDSSGRVFDLTPSQEGPKLRLLTQTDESLATRLLLRGSDLYIATSNIAKLFRVESNAAREGSYESPVKDTSFISRWGMLAWRAEVPAHSSLEFYTRSGNSDRPDRTWSDWAGPYGEPDGTPITSPPARYLQWKAVFRTTDGSTPALNEVTVSYLNQNLPPQIRSLNVSTSSERTSTTGTPAASGTTATTVTVPSAATISFPTTPAASQTVGPTPTTFTWKADDPNGDKLVYALYVKAADEAEWHLVEDKLEQSNYTLEPNRFADGKYVARLVASDDPSNPPTAARRAELASAPFWLDYTPPAVQVLTQQVRSGGAEIRFQVEDATSPLRQAETAIDGKDWRDVHSEDGIADSRLETFSVKVAKLEPGEHIISLRAYDTAGNAGVGKAVVRVAGGTGGSPQTLGRPGQAVPTGR